jgi:hypothetical protein
MSDVFRVVRISDGQEVHRCGDLVGACVNWVKDFNKLRVEQLPAGSTVASRIVSATECCAALKDWLPVNPHFTSDDERKDMAALIRGACSSH